jgi:hypothetical protein
MENLKEGMKVTDEDFEKARFQIFHMTKQYEVA